MKKTLKFTLKTAKLCKFLSRTVYAVSHNSLHTSIQNDLKIDNKLSQTDSPVDLPADKLYHIPVMLNETMSLLQPKDDQLILDMTFGAGGHSMEILKMAPTCKLFVLDRDPVAYNLAVSLSSKFENGQVVPLLGKFTDLPSLLGDLGITPGTFDAVLIDAGCSTMQFDSAERGFSINKDGLLDMRMDGCRCQDSVTAADIVNHMEEKDLCHVIKRYGEERRARDIARAIVEARSCYGNITRTRQLASIISSVFSLQYCKDKLSRPSHVATRTFQALRIFINDELNELTNGLEIARHLLRVGGRCVALTFHSLEDRIVKRIFHGIPLDREVNMSAAKYCSSGKSHSNDVIDSLTERYWDPLTRKVVVQDFKDSLGNPRGRSAKLRGAIRAN